MPDVKLTKTQADRLMDRLETRKDTPDPDRYDAFTEGWNAGLSAAKAIVAEMTER